MTSQKDAFPRSYVAMGYLLGSRDESLLLGLAGAEAVSELCDRLSQPDRAGRATVLAGELTAVARALAEHRLT